MSDDAYLLRRYVEARSESAFAELVERHLGLVYHAALRQVDGNAHLAQDIAQSVFILVAQKARALSVHPSLAGWLHTTTRFKATETKRTENRRHIREQEAQFMHDTLSDSRSTADWEQVRPLLDAAIQSLNEADREVVLLRYFEMRPFAEIAVRCRLTEATAQKRVERALDKLRQRLGGHGITSTSGALAALLGAEAGLAAPVGLAGSVLAGVMTSSVPATALTLIELMSTSKLTIAAAALALLVTGLGLQREVSARRGAEAALASARHEVNERMTTLGALRGREETVDQALASAQAAATEIQAASAAKAAAPALPVRTPRAEQPAVKRGFEYLAMYPSLKQALVERSRARVASNYGDIYRSLAFTPEQIEKFETLMMEQEGVGVSLRGESLTLLPGTGMEPAEVEQHVRDMLGMEGFQQFQETRHTIQARTVATQVAGLLHLTDAPLTTAQLNEVVRVVAAAGTRTSPTGPNDAGVDYGALAIHLQGTLSPPQLQLLAGMAAQNKLNQAMNPSFPAAVRAQAATSTPAQP